MSLICQHCGQEPVDKNMLLNRVEYGKYKAFWRCPKCGKAVDHENLFTCVQSQVQVSGEPIYILSKNGTAELARIPKHAEQLVIPEKAEDVPVTSVLENAAENCQMLKQICLPDSIEYIGESAFSGCSSLAEIDLPKHLSFIHDELFFQCSALREIVIPECATVIREAAFYGCTSLERVVLHEKITCIMCFAFMGCTALKSIQLPSGITKLGYHVFKNCPNLQILVKRGSETEKQCIEKEVVFTAID